ncbi:MAG: hypothetical protein V4671_29220 [Armatimonadota bacterium]
MNANGKAATGLPGMPKAALILKVGNLGDQVYSFEDEDGWQYHWNVSEGMRLAKARGELLTFSPREHGITLGEIERRYPELDVEHALHADLSEPLLFVPFNGKSQLADGWHRMYKAVLTGRDELLVYHLTQEEADSCLLCVLPPGRGLPLRDNKG